MKRGLLIGVGAISGVGAVLSITPPAFTTSSSLGALGGIPQSTGAVTTGSSATPTQAAAQTQAATPTQAATQAATPARTKKATSKATKKATTKKTPKATKTPAAIKTGGSGQTATTPTPTPTQAAATPTPTPTKTTPAPVKTTAAPSGKSGTFTGAAWSQNPYGTFQMQIVVVNGRITDAHFVSLPSDRRSQQIANFAEPVLRQETLAAQSSNINGVGGASYTSYGWYISLQSALKQAGM